MPKAKKFDTKGIKGGFHILVVPKADVRVHWQVHQRFGIPPVYATKDIRVNIFRVVADADENHMGSCVWAFGEKPERDAIVQRLRELANWVEGAGKDLDEARAARGS